MPINQRIRLRPITSVIGVLFLLLSITGLSADAPRATEKTLSTAYLYSDYSAAGADDADYLGSFVVSVPKWDGWSDGRRVLRRTRAELGSLPLRQWLAEHVMEDESISERGRLQAERFVWDLARSAVDEGVLAATEELRRQHFIETINVDFDAGLGERFPHLGVAALGALHESDDAALAWQLRSYVGKEGRQGGNAGLIYRRATDGDWLIGANTFIDYQKEEEDDFLRWSFGVETRSDWADLFANYYEGISDDIERRNADGRREGIWTASGYDVELNLHAPSQQWLTGILGYYVWEGKYGADDVEGVRIGLKVQQPGAPLTWEITYENEDEGDHVGGRLSFRHRFGEASDGVSFSSKFRPRDWFYAPVEREYTQRILRADLSPSNPFRSIGVTRVGGVAGSATFTGGTVAPIVLPASATDDLGAISPELAALLAATVQLVTDNARVALPYRQGGNSGVLFVGSTVILDGLSVELENGVVSLRVFSGLFTVSVPGNPGVTVIARSIDGSGESDPAIFSYAFGGGINSITVSNGDFEIDAGDDTVDRNLMCEDGAPRLPAVVIAGITIEGSCLRNAVVENLQLSLAVASSLGGSGTSENPWVVERNPSNNLQAGGIVLATATGIRGSGHRYSGTNASLAVDAGTGNITFAQSVSGTRVIATYTITLTVSTDDYETVRTVAFLVPAAIPLGAHVNSELVQRDNPANLAANAAAATVIATDGEGPYTYSGADTAALRVNANTGIISFINDVSAQTARTEYVITVIVNDSSSDPAVTVTATVTVAGNELTARGQSDGVTRTPSNLSEGYAVATVFANGGDGVAYTYSGSGDTRDLEVVANGNLGVIRFARDVSDRTIAAAYVITVVVRDGSDSFPVTVTVSVAGEALSANEPTETVSRDNLAANTAVATIIATGGGGGYSYSGVNTDLVINSGSGIIRFARDVSGQPAATDYELEVTVTDSAGTAITVTATISVGAIPLVAESVFLRSDGTGTGTVGDPYTFVGNAEYNDGVFGRINVTSGSGSYRYERTNTSNFLAVDANGGIRLIGTLRGNPAAYFAVHGVTIRVTDTVASVTVLVTVYFELTLPEFGISSESIHSSVTSGDGTSAADAYRVRRNVAVGTNIIRLLAVNSPVTPTYSKADGSSELSVDGAGNISFNTAPAAGTAYNIGVSYTAGDNSGVIRVHIETLSQRRVEFTDVTADTRLVVADDTTPSNPAGTSTNPYRYIRNIAGSGNLGVLSVLDESDTAVIGCTFGINSPFAAGSGLGGIVGTPTASGSSTFTASCTGGTEVSPLVLHYNVIDILTATADNTDINLPRQTGGNSNLDENDVVANITAGGGDGSNYTYGGDTADLQVSNSGVISFARDVAVNRGERTYEIIVIVDDNSGAEAVSVTVRVTVPAVREFRVQFADAANNRLVAAGGTTSGNPAGTASNPWRYIQDSADSGNWGNLSVIDEGGDAVSGCTFSGGTPLAADSGGGVSGTPTTDGSGVFSASCAIPSNVEDLTLNYEVINGLSGSVASTFATPSALEVSVPRESGGSSNLDNNDVIGSVVGAGGDASDYNYTGNGTNLDIDGGGIIRFTADVSGTLEATTYAITVTVSDNSGAPAATLTVTVSVAAAAIEVGSEILVGSVVTGGAGSTAVPYQVRASDITTGENIIRVTIGNFAGTPSFSKATGATGGSAELDVDGSGRISFNTAPATGTTYNIGVNYTAGSNTDIIQIYIETRSQFVVQFADVAGDARLITSDNTDLSNPAGTSINPYRYVRDAVGAGNLGVLTVLDEDNDIVDGCTFNFISPFSLGTGLGGVVGTPTTSGSTTFNATCPGGVGVTDLVIHYNVISGLTATTADNEVTAPRQTGTGGNNLAQNSAVATVTGGGGDGGAYTYSGDTTDLQVGNDGVISFARNVEGNREETSYTITVTVDDDSGAAPVNITVTVTVPAVREFTMQFSDAGNNRLVAADNTTPANPAGTTGNPWRYIQDSADTGDWGDLSVFDEDDNEVSGCTFSGGAPLSVDNVSGGGVSGAPTADGAGIFSASCAIPSDIEDLTLNYEVINGLSGSIASTFPTPSALEVNVPRESGDSSNLDDGDIVATVSGGGGDEIGYSYAHIGTHLDIDGGGVIRFSSDVSGTIEATTYLITVTVDDGSGAPAFTLTVTVSVAAAPFEIGSEILSGSPVSGGSGTAAVPYEVRAANIVLNAGIVRITVGNFVGAPTYSTAVDSSPELNVDGSGNISFTSAPTSGVSYSIGVNYTAGDNSDTLSVYIDTLSQFRVRFTDNAADARLVSADNTDTTADPAGTSTNPYRYVRTATGTGNLGVLSVINETGADVSGCTFSGGSPFTVDGSFGDVTGTPTGTGSGTFSATCPDGVDVTDLVVHYRAIDGLTATTANNQVTAPRLTGGGGNNLAEDSIVANVTGGGGDGGAYTYSGDTTDLQVDNTGAISFARNVEGNRGETDYVIVVTVDDDSGATPASVTVTVTVPAVREFTIQFSDAANNRLVAADNTTPANPAGTSGNPWRYIQNSGDTTGDWGSLSVIDEDDNAVSGCTFVGSAPFTVDGTSGAISAAPSASGDRTFTASCAIPSNVAPLALHYTVIDRLSGSITSDYDRPAALEVTVPRESGGGSNLDDNDIVATVIGGGGDGGAYSFTHIGTHLDIDGSGVIRFSSDVSGTIEATTYAITVTVDDGSGATPFTLTVTVSVAAAPFEIGTEILSGSPVSGGSGTADVPYQVRAGDVTANENIVRLTVGNVVGAPSYTRDAALSSAELGIDGSGNIHFTSAPASGESYSIAVDYTAGTNSDTIIVYIDTLSQFRVQFTDNAADARLVSADGTDASNPAGTESNRWRYVQDAAGNGNLGDLAVINEAGNDASSGCTFSGGAPFTVVGGSGNVTGVSGTPTGTGSGTFSATCDSGVEVTDLALNYAVINGLTAIGDTSLRQERATAGASNLEVGDTVGNIVGGGGDESGYTYGGSNATLEIDNAGNISFVVDVSGERSETDYTITVIVDDGSGATPATVIVTVTVPAVEQFSIRFTDAANGRLVSANDTNNGNPAGVQANPYYYIQDFSGSANWGDLSVVDADGDEISGCTFAGGAPLTVDPATGGVTGTPTTNGSGTFTATCTTPSDVASLQLYYTATNELSASVAAEFTSLSALQVMVPRRTGAFGNLDADDVVASVVGAGGDGDYTYTFTANDNLEIDENSGDISWSVSVSDTLTAQDYAITVTVNDGTGVPAIIVTVTVSVPAVPVLLAGAGPSIIYLSLVDEVTGGDDDDIDLVNIDLAAVELLSSAEADDEINAAALSCATGTTPAILCTRGTSGGLLSFALLENPSIEDTRFLRFIAHVQDDDSGVTTDGQDLSGIVNPFIALLEVTVDDEEENSDTGETEIVKRGVVTVTLEAIDVNYTAQSIPLTGAALPTNPVVGALLIVTANVAGARTDLHNFVSPDINRAADGELSYTGAISRSVLEGTVPVQIVRGAEDPVNVGALEVDVQLNGCYRSFASASIAGGSASISEVASLTSHQIYLHKENGDNDTYHLYETTPTNARRHFSVVKFSPSAMLSVLCRPAPPTASSGRRRTSIGFTAAAPISSR